MRIVIIAVGNRMRGWIDEGYEEYAGRMPRTARMTLVEVRPEPRTSGKTAAQMMELEAARICAAIPAGADIVALDERGREFSSVELARWLEKRMGDGRDLAFVIGGPDGLAPSIKSSAGHSLRLSSLTLPHGLARVVLAEQLYRAMSLLQNHPYHRE